MTSVREKSRISKLKMVCRLVKPTPAPDPAPIPPPPPPPPPVNSSKVSEFYSACRNGDLNYVKERLSNILDTKWNPNQFESTVESTPLHAASYYGHKEIVQLLLQYGCDRSQINGYGLTAYEEAANEEIRQLFKRPPDEFGCNRFQDGKTDDCFIFIKRSRDVADSDHRQETL